MIRLKTNTYKHRKESPKAYKDRIKYYVGNTGIFYCINEKQKKFEVVFNYETGRYDVFESEYKSVHTVPYLVAVCIANNPNLIRYTADYAIRLDVDNSCDYESILERVDYTDNNDVFVIKVKLISASIIRIKMWAIFTKNVKSGTYKAHLFAYDRDLTPLCDHELSMKHLMALNTILLESEFKIYNEFERYVEDGSCSLIEEDKVYDIKDFNEFQSKFASKFGVYKIPDK